MTIEHPIPQLRYWESLPGLLLGLVLLSPVTAGGFWLALVALPVGVVALASAVGLLLWPGDIRLPQFLSLASGLALAPCLVALGGGQLGLAAAISLLGAASWLGAGRISLLNFPRVEGCPPAEQDWPAAARIGTDQALLASFKLILRSPRDAQLERILTEVEEWEGLMGGRRRRKFEHFHPQPPDLLRVEGVDRRLFGLGYRHIRWDSGFPFDDELPGLKEYGGLRPNHKAHAWVLEHPGKPRPWLLTIHGYRMGTPWLDLRAFEPAFLHRDLGLNIASVILPLHGPRRTGMISGSGYLDGDFSAFIHAERQAQWDIRRLLSYLRLNRHATAIGVYGLSLGGYNTALLSGLDGNLACAIAGIPAFDMGELIWRHMPLAERRMLEHAGMDAQRTEQLLRPVSPSSFAARVDPERLGVFAGTVDMLTWPDQAKKLAAHWGGSRLHWFPGSHLTFAGTAAQRVCIKQTLLAGGLIHGKNG